ncbi:hypothetical protein Cgig2_006672 [Carnegiea gigantea]|uniref:Uncharacterized protein n=1 Tax=Carnegiea gigantea TaxID=171969 RepID=A0A9Q1GJC8_9CARY|nr:hypothetical protein Cgig2_006672 [Carnegiea gigantea]
MLMNDSLNVGNKIGLIDAAERLGISYFYEHEIKVMLDQIFEQLHGNGFNNDDDLCDTATQFRIFRQHGYNIPCDVFKKFTNSKGKYAETMRSDVKGMVSLYEAAHLRVHGEEILENALIFTTNFLESVAKSSEQAHRALKHPLHHTMLRVGNRHFISAYEKDESRNETLLHLAKMDFNRLQMLHQRELSQLQKWWSSFNFTKRLPYIRDRSVESHFVANGVYFEPEYSLGRISLAKVVLVITVLDDTYDAYGTLEELQLLTTAFERWDLNAMDQLSENMKIVYEFVINLYDDFAKDMTKKGKPYAAEYAKELVMDSIRYYMEEVKRREVEYTPTYEEYMVEGRLTGNGPILLISSLMGMDEIASIMPFQRIRQAPKSIRGCELICRLVDDIQTHEIWWTILQLMDSLTEEQARGDAPSAVECYMKEYSVSRREAIERFEKMIEDAWKDINEAALSICETENHDGLKEQEVPKPVFERVLNLCHLVNVLYKYSDGFTHPAKVIKDHVTALYANPFSI